MSLVNGLQKSYQYRSHSIVPAHSQNCNWLMWISTIIEKLLKRNEGIRKLSIVYCREITPVMNVAVRKWLRNLTEYNFVSNGNTHQVDTVMSTDSDSFSTDNDSASLFDVHNKNSLKAKRTRIYVYFFVWGMLWNKSWDHCVAIHFSWQPDFKINNK